jgi:hypothetical protein
LCFPLGGKGRRFFSGILISPRLIKSAIASRMSSASLRLFREGFSIEDRYGIPRAILKELRESKFSRIMENVSARRKCGSIMTCPDQTPSDGERICFFGFWNFGKISFSKNS